MNEYWYRIKTIPDLTLNKYASLEDSGVDGVLEKHIAFLRQLNRKGILSELSFHLFYLYISPDDKKYDLPGKRLQLFFMVKNSGEAVENIPALVESSPLSEFFEFSDMLFTDENDKKVEANIENYMNLRNLNMPEFKFCSFLTKTETLLPSGSSEIEDYYILRDWEMNESGRLYNMFKMMEALNKTALYRVDLFPVERSEALRKSLRTPMNYLRKKQEDRMSSGRKDYDSKDVLDNYDKLIEKFDSSPHFISNIMVFANTKEDSTSILDAAGAESLLKGKYNISTFTSRFNTLSFISGEVKILENIREKMVIKPNKRGLIVCREDTVSISLNYLPTMFSLEEITPFFRFPALYDGEVIQLPKETAPFSFDGKDALFLGKDKNGYDINFPLDLLPKHAFISGVPGSGKTNTMHHITSSLWKDHKIPFLVLEPAKQEYRALANDPGMEAMYLFSPNADMSFPLHINPFEMPKGIMVAEHIRRLCSVFEGAFPLEPPMPFLLDTAIESVYRELGWIPEHVYTGDEVERDKVTKRKLPTMSMLYRRLEEELKTTTYSDEVRGNLESALQVRIGSLLRREMGDVFDVPKSTFPPEKWLEVPAVIELESMGTGPANFLTLMLCSLIRETLKVNPLCERNLRHVIFIEEAHNLIGPESEVQPGTDADPKQAATAFVVKMLAEVRALKEGIVIADQLPTVMAQEVLKNTGLKIALRITSADDRNLLGSTMAASSMQLEQMATYEVGESLIFYEKLRKPFNIRIKEWWGELTDKNQKKAMVTAKNDNDLRLAMKDHPTYCDANKRSIEIIGEKYVRLLIEIEENLNPTINWYNATISVANKLKEYDKNFIDIEKGIISVSQEKKAQLYDNHLAIVQMLSNNLSNQKYLDLPFTYIKTLIKWIFTLERLKKGRWQRCNASDRDLVRISIIESKMIDKCLNLYSIVKKAFDTSKEIEKVLSKRIIEIQVEIDDIIKINNDTNELIKEYVINNGEQSLYNN